MKTGRFLEGHTGIFVRFAIRFRESTPCPSYLLNVPLVQMDLGIVCSYKLLVILYSTLYLKWPASWLHTLQWSTCFSFFFFKPPQHELCGLKSLWRQRCPRGCGIHIAFLNTLHPDLILIPKSLLYYQSLILWWNSNVYKLSGDQWVSVCGVNTLPSSWRYKLHYKFV